MKPKHFLTLCARCCFCCPSVSFLAFLCISGSRDLHIHETHNLKADVIPNHKMYTLDASSAYAIEKPQGTYVYDIIEVADGIVSISSDDQIRLHNPLSLESDPIYSISKSHAEITCLKALDADNSIVVTAGRDGKVRVSDLRQRSTITEVRSSKWNPNHFIESATW